MERVAVDSSNLVSIGYDENSGILEIEFRSGVYQYFDVPSFVYEELVSSDSKGLYFNNNIRGVYNFSPA